MSNLYPCIWFNNNAKEAMQFYSEVFPSVEITDENPVVVIANIEGMKLMGLNGGDRFKPNPSISFMVICEDRWEAESYWEKLIYEGKVLMPLDRYDWSEKYGFVEDKYGVSWQIYTGNYSDVGQKIVPNLMFGGANQGKADLAMDFYLHLFENSKGHGIMRYADGPTAGQVQHAQFDLNGYVVMAMDSGVEQDYSFTPGISLVVECENQESIDYFWNSFTKNGREEMCGWCVDEFGVSWQVVPKELSLLMKDPEKGQLVMAALMKMKKIDIETLRNA